jgi:hypothetical protein
MKNLFALLIFTFIVTAVSAQTKEMEKGDSFDAVLVYCPSAMSKIPFTSKDGTFGGTGKTNSPNWRIVRDGKAKYIYRIVGVQ